jgi:transcriptional regulator with XRE-family HTH domain
MPVRKIGDVVRELREARGLTQAQLAERAQVALSYVNVIEAAQQESLPPRQILQRLARALGVPLKRLLEPEGWGRLLGKLARMDVLLLDDWGLAPPQDQERRDLFEILEDRYGSRSTIVTSQLPPAQWHDHIGEPTLADAICDRLLHNAHRIVPKGPSRRKEGKLDSWSVGQHRSAPVTIP